MLLDPERVPVAGQPIAPLAPPRRNAWQGVAWMRAICILFAAGDAWISRYALGPDGTAYLDLARAWLRGDWTTAFNSYWSPLYAWLLAGTISLLPAGSRSELFAGHLINFAGFLLALFAGEFLLREWTATAGAPRHPRLVALAGYLTLAWVSLHLVGLGFNSADIYVMAEVLFVAAMLVRIRRRAAGSGEFALLGLALGAGFLAKAAGAVLIVAALPVAAVLLRSATHKGIRIAAACCALVTLPFVCALSLAKHRFVYSDAGQVNYKLVVGGNSLEGYKDSIHPPPAGLPHPLRVRHEDPRVVSFEDHLTGTFPVHADPSWWTEGYPASAAPGRQWTALRSGIIYSLTLAAQAPALWLLFLAALAGAVRIRRLSLRRVWPVALVAAAATAPYWLIVVHPRYIAGPLALTGFLAIAAAWHAALPRLAQRAACVAMLLAAAIPMWVELAVVPFYTIGEPLGIASPPEKINIKLAETMRREGLRAGDRVAYIGDTLDGTWLALDGAQIVAMVPARVYHDESTAERPIREDFAGPDRYWRSSPAQRDEVMRAFREAGAKWVFADDVPPGADVSGWSVAGSAHRLRGEDSDKQFFRRID